MRAVVFYVTGTMTIFVTGWWLLQGAVWIPPSPLGWLQVLMLAIVGAPTLPPGLLCRYPRRNGQLALLGPLETMLSVIWAVIFLH